MKLKPNLKGGDIDNILNHKYIKMKSENLSELSLIELTKKEKDSKSILNISIALLIVSPILIVILLFQKQFISVYFLMFLTVFSSVFQVINQKKQLSDIKNEIEIRENNEL